MKAKVIIAILFILFSCVSCFQVTVPNIEEDDITKPVSVSTTPDDKSNNATDAMSVLDTMPNNDLNSDTVNKENLNRIKEIQFGNKDDIILKTDTFYGTENSTYAAVIGRISDSIYCLDCAKQTGVMTYTLDHKELKVVRKPVSDKSVIRLAHITGDWMIWEEDEDKIVYDDSYGKNWAIYAQNMKTEELIEIDKDKNIKASDNSVLIYTAPRSISVSNERFVYTVYDILDDGFTYAVIKMYDLSQKREYILDSVREYEKGFYSYPDIDGDNVVWSYSTCNERFPGDERGYTYLYNIATKEKKQISSRDDILWPTIYEDYIAARVKPNGLNENSEIVLYEIGGDGSWETIVSPESDMYAGYSHVEILLPDINGGYLTWGDNVHEDFTIYDLRGKTFYKLYVKDKSNSQLHDAPNSFRFSYQAYKMITWSEFYINVSENKMQYDYKYVILK